MHIDQKKAFRAEAHHLKPCISIGVAGLTPAVQKELNLQLDSHGLIKVKLHIDEKEARQVLIEQLCNAMQAQLVQSIGKIIVIYRTAAIKEKEHAPNEMAPQTHKIRKVSRSHRRAPLREVIVMANQRITQGGLVKRKKNKQYSFKKTAR